MEHGHLDITGAAFWIFIAVVVWATTWEKARRNAEKHETLRRIIEKTGSVDESKLKELFAPPPLAESWKSSPGGGYRALRIIGTVVVGIGAAVAVLAVLMGQFGPAPRQPGALIALCGGFAISLVGLAIFLSSRFAEPPSDQKHDRDR